MSVEVGQVILGKVTGITNFGAFIDLGNRKTGLVHISEVSDSYIKDIKDVLTVGQEVNVKIMSIADDGKISLSVRRAVEKREDEGEKTERPYKPAAKKTESFQSKKPASFNRGSFASKPSPSQSKADDFDSLMSAFLKDSEDRLTSLKRNTEGKRGGRGGRRS